MKTKWKKVRAFTLAEIMVVFGIIAVVSSATIGIQKSRTDYVDKFMYYAAFKDVQQVVSAMISDGFTLNKSTAVTNTAIAKQTTTVNQPVTITALVNHPTQVNQPVTTVTSVNQPLWNNHQYLANEPITTPTNVNNPTYENQPITTTTSTNVNTPVYVNHPVTSTVSVNHPITSTVSVNHPITNTVSVNHPVLVNHPVSVNHPITTNVTTRTTYTDQQIFSYLSANEKTLKFFPPDSGNTSYASNPATNSTTLILYGSTGSSVTYPGLLMTDVAGDVTRALKAALPTMDSAKFNAAISAATTATNAFYTYSEAHPLAVTSPLNGRNQTQIDHTGMRRRDLSQMVKTFLVEFDKAAGATGADLGTDSPGTTTRVTVSGSNTGGAFNVTAPVTTDNWVLEDNWVLTDNWVNETTTTDNWVNETTVTDNWVNETVTTDHWGWDDSWAVVTTSTTVDNFVWVDHWSVVNIVTDNWVWKDNYYYDDNWVSVSTTVDNWVNVDNWVTESTTTTIPVTVDTWITTETPDTKNVPTPIKALAPTGEALCANLIEKINTSGAAPACTQTADDFTNFATATPNFTTSNGMRWFNFGSNPTYIGSTGGYAVGTGTEYGNEVYTIYIDIDGASKGTNTLNSDIMKFYFSRDGSTILPAPESIGAQNTNYLSANIRYKSGASYVRPLQGIPYKEAVCKARLVPATFHTRYGYCNGVATDATYTTCSGQSCEVESNTPGI